ncbi:MAG: acyl-CoA mutase large subunit family protein [Aromatoleum sp.]|jgi:methylmalonyl-CoA mutase N-terminal domain/subunit|uniref:acyl-CoA mutase large subunit family protein n=1 Tax=Aromatoleum sp. TaxID=2307007 RepID=UPI002895F1AC|nr:acyl-CoA mutase large subunit family protein [Aromatoleum sp.]MDT3669465.1 acyl-CoA mutase large subunit family protein [Aromatoleum sp.]
MSAKGAAAGTARDHEEQIFETGAGIDINEMYRPDDVGDFDSARDLGEPGEFPFTRGPYPGMYRERIWTRRFQVGFGSPQETNERIKYLHGQGANGFVITIDLPTSYGFDSDDPVADGEVGVTGVPISTLEDMETLYDGFGPDAVSYALSIRPPVSSVTLAMLAAVAEKKNVPFEKVIGTQQNDPFYQMSGGPLQTITQFFPLDGTLRLCVDNIEFISKNMPRLNWMVTNGYNLRETGVDAIQDGAFSLGHAFAIYRRARERGLDVNLFPRKASFFLSCSIDFFEEIAKFRAMRRLYAKTMRDEFGATNPECWRLRFSVQSAGNTLTRQQPQVNIIRASVEAMAAVFGGAQSIHLCSYDEAHGLPTEESSRIALRTQQVIAYESGITKTIDPLGGSWYVESLTNRMEAEIRARLEDIDRRGGMIDCIREGWLEQQINGARIKNQADLDSGRRTLVGVNRFTIAPEDETPLQIHKIKADVWGARRAEYLRDYRAGRDAGKWAEAMARIELAWKAGDNMVPVLMDALKNKATMGECHEAMRQAQSWSFR